jgi:excisionase family DNA binding protein
MSLKLLNTKDAAKKLGISPRRVRELIDDGTLTAQRVGREWVIEESALAGVVVYGVKGRPSNEAREKAAKKATKKSSTK